LALGGIGPDGKNTAANQAYDPLRDRWTHHAPMPTPRDHHAITVINEKLHAIAGRINGDHDRSIGVHEEYNPATDGWSIRPAIPSIRSGIAAATLNGEIFIFGGESERRTRNQVESFDPVKNRWQSWADMPTARHGLGAVAWGESIYVISGGPKPGTSFSSANEVFTP
jgi:N-acetylneuraminic acid mutarotase